MYIGAQCKPLDVVFVLDSSGSIKRENWPLVLNFTKEVINHFTVGPEATQVSPNRET